MPCLYCGRRVPLVRQLSDRDFCSEDHRARYRKLANSVLDRLGGPLGGQAIVAATEKPSKAEPPKRNAGPAGPLPSWACFNIRALACLGKPARPDFHPKPEKPRLRSDLQEQADPAPPAAPATQGTEPVPGVHGPVRMPVSAAAPRALPDGGGIAATLPRSVIAVAARRPHTTGFSQWLAKAQAEHAAPVAEPAEPMEAPALAIVPRPPAVSREQALPEVGSGPAVEIHAPGPQDVPHRAKSPTESRHPSGKPKRPRLKPVPARAIPGLAAPLAAPVSVPAQCVPAAAAVRFAPLRSLPRLRGARFRAVPGTAGPVCFPHAECAGLPASPAPASAWEPATRLPASGLGFAAGADVPQKSVIASAPAAGATPSRPGPVAAPPPADLRSSLEIPPQPPESSGLETSGDPRLVPCAHQSVHPEAAEPPARELRAALGVSPQPPESSGLSASGDPRLVPCAHQSVHPEAAEPPATDLRAALEVPPQPPESSGLEKSGDPRLVPSARQSVQPEAAEPPAPPRAPAKDLRPKAGASPQPPASAGLNTTGAPRLVRHAHLPAVDLRAVLGIAPQLPSLARPAPRAARQAEPSPEPFVPGRSIARAGILCLRQGLRIGSPNLFASFRARFAALAGRRETEPEFLPWPPLSRLPAWCPEPTPYAFPEPAPEPRRDYPAMLRGMIARVPAPVRIALLTVPVLLTFAFWLRQSAPSISASAGRALRERAAVEVMDDFRQGMKRWHGARDWTRSPEGMIRTGQFGVLEIGRPLRDYDFEFLGQIRTRSIGWVFRATDAKNYYGGSLVVRKSGPVPEFALERYAVIDGRREPSVSLPVPRLMHNDTPYRILVRVRGDGFATFIEGQLVDYWTDGRLKSGGVGFAAPKDDRAFLYWVKVSFQNDWLGRLCARLAPGNQDSTE